MNRHQLPVLNGHVAESSIYADGTRKKIEPAAVHGRFDRARHVVFSLLVAIWVLLPIVPVGGHPALFLDVEHRRFFVFGGTFSPQDFWLVFFLATGVGFGLVYATAVAGRVWCGWACPQTVFMETFYRPIERMTKKNKWMRHLLFLATSVVVAHVFIAYFVSIRALWTMMLGSPAAHPEAFVWMVVLTGVFYGNFAFFREQLCVVLCPYGRLQSVLLDDDSLVVAYDEKRGEPRGKKGKTTGDCVDCRRCVVVCPTGIDIRNGLQMDCIACTACIDACDEIMDKLERPRGLIAYRRGKILRPRVYLYTVLLFIGATVFFFATRTRTSFDASLTRLQGPPFTREDHVVRNDLVVHLVNKSAEDKTYDLVPEPFSGATFAMASGPIRVPALSDTRIPIIVRAPDTTPGHAPIRIRVSSGKEARVVEAVFLGGGGR